jgi:hypothetical protein
VVAVLSISSLAIGSLSNAKVIILFLTLIIFFCLFLLEQPFDWLFRFFSKVMMGVGDAMMGVGGVMGAIGAGGAMGAMGVGGAMIMGAGAAEVTDNP